MSPTSTQRRSRWSGVVNHMVDSGVLGSEKQSLRPTRHPVINPNAQELLRREIQSLASGNQPLTHRTESLLALAGPCQMLEVVAPFATGSASGEAAHPTSSRTGPRRRCGQVRRRCRSGGLNRPTDRSEHFGDGTFRSKRHSETAVEVARSVLRSPSEQIATCSPRRTGNRRP